MLNIRRRVLVPIAVAAIALASPCFAQAPTKIVSGFPPGGGVDLVARLLADQFAKQGGTYIVENKTGAGGIIALQGMVTAPADGTVLLVAPDSNVVIYPHTVSNPGFDMTRDLVPVAILASYDLALSVRGGDSSINDFASFIAAAKQDPKRATFASPAAGSLQHFYGLSVGKAAGVELLHVPYRGVAPAVTDTIGGQVGGLVTPVGPVIQHAEGGALRILATSGTERGRKTPNVPTLKELGYPQLVAHGWFGLFAPAKTPPETLQRISKMAEAAVKSLDFQAKLAALDMDATWVSPSEFRALVVAEDRKWARTVKESGFRADR